jgi:hypothetical protein
MVYSMQMYSDTDKKSGRLRLKYVTEFWNKLQKKKKNPDFHEQSTRYILQNSPAFQIDFSKDCLTNTL